nr:unnamed protein product [Spirometra erinaceieuropaei]
MIDLDYCQWIRRSINAAPCECHGEIRRILVGMGVWMSVSLKSKNLWRLRIKYKTTVPLKLRNIPWH